MKKSSNILDIVDISANYGSQRVLENVSFSLEDGEVLVIVGPSGGGKTTLLKCLNLLHFPSKGKIFYQDKLIASENNNLSKKSVYARIMDKVFGLNINLNTELYTKSIHNYRKNFGFVFQEFNLWPDYTLKENIEMPLKWNNDIEKSEIKKRVSEVAYMVQIEDILDKYPNEVSGGQKQRTGIARAIIGNPKVLLLDEVTSALDPDLVYEILQLIEKLVSMGISMVIVTHHLQFARRISNKISFLDRNYFTSPIDSDKFFNCNDIRIKSFLEHLLKI
jgi:polar amino acid transport system ATP-binding protein